MLFPKSSPSSASFRPPSPPSLEAIEDDLANSSVDDVVFVTALPDLCHVTKDEAGGNNHASEVQSKAVAGKFELTERFLHLKKVLVISIKP